MSYLKKKYLIANHDDLPGKFNDRNRGFPLFLDAIIFPSTEIREKLQQ